MFPNRQFSGLREKICFLEQPNCNQGMTSIVEFADCLLPILKKPIEAQVFEFKPDHNSVKHWIEYFSVPHSEVGSIQVRGVEVDFSYRPQAGDRIFVQALKGPVDVSRPTLLRPEAFLKNHFIVDECVANLASKLRMLGCNAIADRRWTDLQIAQISAAEKRVILTRDRGLLKRKEVVWGRFIRSTDPREQIKEVIHFFALENQPQAFTRCMACNGELKSVSKAEILDRLEPKTILYFDQFSQCSNCEKIYWEGCHYEKMQADLKELVSDSEAI